MSMKWPKPIKHEEWCPILKDVGKCACHAGDINDMLEDCKKAYEEAHLEALVPLDEEYIASQLASCLRLGAYLSHNSAINKKDLELRYINHAKMEAKSICSKFGSPKVPSVKEIEITIKKILLASCTCNNGIGIVCVGCFYRKDLAKAIHDLLGG